MHTDKNLLRASAVPLWFFFLLFSVCICVHLWLDLSLYRIPGSRFSR
jgi:hypothetical protein